MTLFPALIAAGLLLSGGSEAAPEIDRTALTWCQITPTAGASATLITVGGLHRTIADAQRLTFNPGDIAAVANAGEQVPVSMSCDLAWPVAWATVTPADTIVIDTPQDEMPTPPAVLIDPDSDPHDVQVAAAPGIDATVLIAPAAAHAEPEQPPVTVAVVPAPVDTVPPTTAAPVRSSLFGRARTLAVHALQAVA